MIVLMLSHTLRNILVSPVSASAGIRDYQIWMIAQCLNGTTIPAASRAVLIKKFVVQAAIVPINYLISPNTKKTTSVNLATLSA